MLPIQRELGQASISTRMASAQMRIPAAAGILICALAILVLMLAWPSSRWIGNISDLTAPLHLAPVALANGVVLVAVYLGVAALAWAIADATMPQPRDFHGFH